MPDPAAFDLANALLAPVPCEMTCTLATSPATGEQALIVTIRDPSGTSTWFLSAEQARSWHDLLGGKIARMSALVLPPRPGLNGRVNSPAAPPGGPRARTS